MNVFAKNYAVTAIYKFIIFGVLVSMDNMTLWYIMTKDTVFTNMTKKINKLFIKCC